MKVVLDTNVIVAAFATRGLCAAVFQLCLTKYRIVLSEYILSEVAEGLANKIRLPHARDNSVFEGTCSNSKNRSN